MVGWGGLRGLVWGCEGGKGLLGYAVAEENELVHGACLTIEFAVGFHMARWNHQMDDEVKRNWIAMIEESRQTFRNAPLAWCTR
jgi:hypothetical protein